MVKTTNSRYAQRFLFLVLSLCVAAPAFAQGGLLWATTSIGADLAYSVAHADAVAVDAVGDFVVTGYFGGSVDFGGGPLTALASLDVFLAKYDGDGNHIWSSAFGGLDGEYPRAIAIDPLGNITITGQFKGSLDFGGGTLDSAGSQDIFVAQFDSSGNHIWSRAIGGPESDDGRGIAVDGAGNVTVTGYAQGVVNFGGGNRGVGSNVAGFVAQYDATGTHRWSRVFGGGYSGSKDIAIDVFGNVAVTGSFGDAVDFGGGPIPSAGGNDIFVAQYDSAGNHIQSFGTGGPNREEANGIAVDATGRIALTGRFNWATDLGGGAIGGETSYNVFVAQYDSIGNHLWSRGLPNVSSEYLTAGHSVAADASGNLAITGMFAGTIDFGGGPIKSAGYRGAFIAQYDSAGSHLWSRGLGKISSASSQAGNDVVLDASGNVVVAGAIATPVDFGDGEEVGSGKFSMFLAKYTGDPAVAVAAAARANGSGGCFIATATYGTPMAEDINALRNIRDTYLMDSALGTVFVDTYYRISPPMADAVSQSPILQTVVRAFLTPIVLLSKIILATPGLALAFAIMTMTTALSLGLRRARRMSKARAQEVS